MCVVRAAGWCDAGPPLRAVIMKLGQCEIDYEAMRGKTDYSLVKGGHNSSQSDAYGSTAILSSQREAPVKSAPNTIKENGPTRGVGVSYMHLFIYYPISGLLFIPFFFFPLALSHSSQA